MPLALLQRIERGIRERALWGDDDRLAVAASGGSDSVALLHLLSELAGRATWTLAGVIHVHHGLRGADADDDEAFCRRLADRLGLPIDVEHVDVPGARHRTGRSLEAVARGLRYDAFEVARMRLGATVVATGHTCDDQAETVLLRLLRGATVRGASAIRPRRGVHVRPLLDCRRDELRRYLADRGEPFREDASNTDVSVPRNRLRHEVMPVIARAWPGGVAALARFAELARADERLLSELAALEGRQVIRMASDGVELNRGRLASLDPALARRVVRDALEAAGGTPRLREVDAVLRLARGRPRARIDLHGVAAVAREDWIRLGTPRPPTVVPDYEYRLDVPGEVHVVETGATVRASFLEGSAHRPQAAGWDASIILPSSAAVLPLTVRRRRPGDRIRPSGGSGSRTLQDLMVDRKVPQNERAAVPIVVDAQGRIVWVAGLAAAAEEPAGTPPVGMVVLEFKKGIL